MPLPRLSLPGWPLWLALPLAGACHQGPAPVDDSGGPDTADELFGAITLTRSEQIPTVVTATWTTSTPVTCTLTYGVEGGRTLTTLEAGAPATTHQVALVGLRPDSAGALVVSAEVGGLPLETAEQPFTTGTLPPEAPGVTIEQDDPARSFQGFTLTPLIHDGYWLSWLCIFDPDGQLVWAYQVRHGANRARLMPDGRGLMYLDVDVDPGTQQVVGAVYALAWDGTELWRFEDENLHHDFAILGDDRFVSLGRRIEIVDAGQPSERYLMGDTLMEFDRAGNAVEVWDVFDDLDPLVIPTTAIGPDPGAETWDWSHANYLTWVPERGELLVSLRELDAIVAVDMDRAELTWSLSNTWGTYRAPDAGHVLEHPHCAEPVAGGLAVFNQSYKESDGDCSWSAILDLDAGSGEATTTWRYQTEDCLRLNYLGSVQPLPNGDQLAVFSQAGIMDEVTPEGERVRRFRSSFGWIFGYAHQAEELVPLVR
ncbi:MAG: aryl-sulfate sulfotransferase [Pseudomonadota bacterium]